jgi:tetratricopeptide (TPR) repeat protein
MGLYNWMRGNQEQFLELNQRTLAIAETLGDFDLQVQSTYYVGVAYHFLGNYPQAMNYFKQVVALLASNPFWGPVGVRISLTSVISRAWLVWSFAEVGRFVEGIGIGEEGIRIAEASDQPITGIVVYLTVGMAALRKGELDRAIVVLERGLELC